MTVDCFRSRSSHDGPQHQRDDDHVVGVAQHRNEVGDKIERQRQVRDEQAQPRADAAGHARIGTECLQQAHQIRDQPLCFGKADPSRTNEHEHHEEHEPRHRNRDSEADEQRQGAHLASLSERNEKVVGAEGLEPPTSAL